MENLSVIPLKKMQVDMEMSKKDFARKSASLESNTTSTSSQSSFCRICHESEETLMIACKCRGTIAYTHSKCLVEWLVRSGKPRCELCGADYTLRVRQTHGWITLFTKRLTSHDKAMILVGSICCLFLISTTTWLLWSALSPVNATQRSNELFQTCYALYGFMDVFCLGILVHEFPHMILLWKRIKLLRYELYVLPHPSSKQSSSEPRVTEDVILHIVSDELSSSSEHESIESNPVERENVRVVSEIVEVENVEDGTSET